MTNRQAYDATYLWVDNYNVKSASPDIVVFLSGMATLENGNSWDPAMIWDWRKIAPQDVLTTEEARAAAVSFLQRYSKFPKFSELEPIAINLSENSEDWESTVTKVLRFESGDSITRQHLIK